MSLPVSGTGDTKREAGNVIDYALFKVINGWAGNWPLFDLLVRVAVNDYVIPTTLSLGLLFLWFGGRQEAERRLWQQAAIHSVLALLLVNGLVKLLNLVLFRHRPFFDHAVHLLFYRPTDSSWPSNPAAVTLAVATAVWLRDRRAGIGMMGLALAMSLARVLAGVHYPSDVLSGGLLGWATAYFLYRQDDLLQPFVGHFISFARRFDLA